MKPSTFLVAALSLVPGALAVDKMKNVIVWAQDDSITDSMLDKAKNAIIEAGGKVTHVYTLIRYVPLFLYDDSQKRKWSDKY